MRQLNPKFHEGEQVIDRDSEEGGKMIVLDPNVGQAGDVQVELDGDQYTVAELNPDYPPQDPVVRVVYVEWLDQHVPSWGDWVDSQLFVQKLRNYADEWSVPLRTYDFPESRLASVVGVSNGSDDGGSPTAAPTSAGEQWPSPSPNQDATAASTAMS